MILWLELPDDRIVGSTLINPAEPPVSFARTLHEAMNAPMVGPPRRPARVRVADAALAAEIRQAETALPVVVAPTPELDAIVRLMAKSMEADGHAEPTYLDGGRISPEVVRTLFCAAQDLFKTAPWKLMCDQDIIRLDIPALGVESACLSVIGALGEAVGFLIFASGEVFEEFIRAAEAHSARNHEGPFELRGPILSLNFERGANLPRAARREVAEHGWPVAGPAAYPWVDHRDRDGARRPLGERDYRIASACALVFPLFFLKHRDLFERNSFPPVCESYFDEDNLEVRFTLPYEAGRMFPVNVPGAAGRQSSLAPRRTTGAGERPPAIPTKVGRNAPCPCGSGRKYKKCCLAKEEAAREAAEGAEWAPAEIHQVDERLLLGMTEFASDRFGSAWRRAGRDFQDPEAALQLFLPWSVYHFTVDGKPVVEWFLDEQGHRLSSAEIGWLQAQQDAWLSVWEVLSVEPGRSLSVTDLLTGEPAVVDEVSASKTLVSRDAILGRIVEGDDGVSVLCGVHPNPLPPMRAAEVVRRVRGRLRCQRPIPPERLRDYKATRYLIARWEEEVEKLNLSRSVPPKLQNTDGDDLLLTTDHFEFKAAAGREIERRLASLEGVKPPEPEDDGRVYAMTRPGNPMNPGWDNTVTGRVEVLDGKLRLETNSIKRADALRQRIEDACGELLRHRAREHTDPAALLRKRREGKARPERSERSSDIPPEVAQRLIRESKEKHYAAWTDQSLPALDGKTPREAVRTKAGRTTVNLILKECENAEGRLPEAERFDFSRIRRDLGLGG